MILMIISNLLRPVVQQVKNHRMRLRKFMDRRCTGQVMKIRSKMPFFLSEKGTTKVQNSTCDVF